MLSLILPGLYKIQFGKYYFGIKCCLNATELSKRMSQEIFFTKKIKEQGYG